MKATRFLLLLLVPALLSVTAPPTRIPDLHRYKSRSGDCIVISPHWKEDGQLNFTLYEGDPCSQSVGGRAYAGKKHHFDYTGPGGGFYFKVTKRRIKVRGSVVGCGDFEGTYRRTRSSQCD